MVLDRKKFLRITGLSAMGLAAKKAAGVFRVPFEPQAGSAGSHPVRRWAMVVDVRQCQKSAGCDRCIQACNRRHNIPTLDDKRHEVKWIWRAFFKDAFISEKSEFANAAFQNKSVIVLCNHCDRPPCVQLCPTHATWKRDDGIITMDWHRCIGCRYCMAACPYGARSFNWVDPRPHISELNIGFPTRARGVVEKCTFCADLINAGEQPACVIACESHALCFGDLRDPDSEARRRLGSAFCIRRKAELGTVPQVYYVV